MIHASFIPNLRFLALVLTHRRAITSNPHRSNIIVRLLLRGLILPTPQHRRIAARRLWLPSHSLSRYPTVTATAAPITLRSSDSIVRLLSSSLFTPSLEHRRTAARGLRLPTAAAPIALHGALVVIAGSLRGVYRGLLEARCLACVSQYTVK